MDCLDISFSLPQENILFDEFLLFKAEKGFMGESLRFWESEKLFVVLGRIGQEQDDLQLKYLKEDQIPVLRRASGGGTVLQGRGCLNFSFVLSKQQRPELNDLKKSYEKVLGWVLDALKLLKVEASFFPISDLALTKNQKKFSGNAQKRGRNFILHHGTILYQFPLHLMERYLNMPKDRPEYRGTRGHLDFVTNIDCDREKFKFYLQKVLGINSVLSQMLPEDRNEFDKFMAEHKGRWEVIL